MNIIQEAQAQCRTIVTRRGGKVTIYRTDAPGKYPIHGCIEGGETPTVSAWTLEGEINLGGKWSDLALYSMQEHFDWGILPGWADMCVFKVGQDWFCSSVVPDWSKKEKRFKLHHSGASYVLPEVVTSTILMEVEERDSLFINPKYDDEI